MSTESTSTEEQSPPEQIHGVLLYLINPLAKMTTIEGESNRQYIFQKVGGEHPERQVFHCGGIAEYRAICRDLLGPEERPRKKIDYQLWTEFMTVEEMEAKRVKEAAQAESRANAEKKARAEYVAGLPTALLDNARTLVKLKAKRDNLDQKVKDTQFQPLNPGFTQELADLDVTVEHMARLFDSMLTEHAEHYGEPAHAALNGQIIAIFDGAARPGGTVVDTLPTGGGGSVEPIQEQAPMAPPVELPPDLVIIERLEDVPAPLMPVSFPVPVIAHQPEPTEPTPPPEEPESTEPAAPSPNAGPQSPPKEKRHRRTKAQMAAARAKAARQLAPA